MRPRIFVLHIRQIIKIGIGIVVGLILLFTMLYIFLGGGGETGTVSAENTEAYEHKAASLFSPGVFRGYVHLNYEDAVVYVTVSESEIISIELEALTENQALLYPLLKTTLENMAHTIIQNQNLVVEKDHTNTATTLVLLEAIREAVTSAVNTPSFTYPYQTLQEGPEL